MTEEILSSGIGKKYLDTIIKRLAGLYTDREDIVNRFALLSGIVGRFRRAFVQMMKQEDWYRKYMEQKLIKGFVAFSAIIICQQRMCCLNMFVIIRNEQGYFKDLQI